MIAAVALLLAQVGPAPAPRSEAQGVQPGCLQSMEEELQGLYEGLRPVLVQVRVPYRWEDETGRREEEQLTFSGMILDRGGLLVAPGNLQPDAQGILVVDRRAREYPARLVAQDGSLGLSLLQAEGLNVPPPRLGCPDALRIGAVTLSLGNGLGLEGSLDVGFLAGKQRSIAKVGGLLQITNHINLGDGGGVLADRRGQVVGILFTSLEEAARRYRELTGDEAEADLTSARGVGFAVPIDRVLRAFAPYLERPALTRREMGVHLFPEPVEVHVPGVRTGLLVMRVLPGTAAARAGLRPDDILVQAGASPCPSLECLAMSLSLAEDDMSVWVVRDGRKQRLELRFTTEAREADPAVPAKKSVGAGAARRPR